MKATIYMKSLAPDSEVLAWTTGGCWENLPAGYKIPGSLWLANQAGLQVGCVASIDIDSWTSLLAGLNFVHKELVAGARSMWADVTYHNIHPLRWNKLAEPRPTGGDIPGEPLLIAARTNGLTYGLALGDGGYGGWYQLDKVPDLSGHKHFDLWDYCIYIMKEPVTLTVSQAKRMLTSTFDCLLTYDSTFTDAKQYLAYATPVMKELWNGGGKA